MEKIKVIALVGKAGAGKDYLLRYYTDLFNGKVIVSCTTRPKREYEIEGKDYHFLSEEEFAAACFVEETEFNNWHYGTRYEDLDPDHVNVGVFNPAGIRALATNEDIELSVVYVKASAKTRLLRQLNREKDPNVYEIIRRFSADEADFQDDKDFTTLGKYFYYFWNDTEIGQE